MHALPRAGWVIAGLVTMTAPAIAQPSPVATTWLVGVGGAAFRTLHPHGGTAGLGGTLAIDRVLNPFLSLRAQLRGMRMFATADDISLCTPLPVGGCWPDAVFPDQIWDVQAGALVRLWHAPRLWVVLGVAATDFVGAREPERNARLHDRRSRWRTGWRTGVELALGSSRRAPRVQYARSMYSRPTLDLTGLHNIALLLPF